MRRMKKTTLILLSILLLVVILATCAPEIFSANEPELIGTRFVRTRRITVEVYDRSNPGGTKPENNFWTDWIKKGVLRDHNIVVNFVPIPRWTEVEVINNRLAAGDAPDVCVTYSYPTIQAYANMGGVIDLGPYLRKYKKLLPNLYKLLGEQNLFWDEDPETGTVWAIEARRLETERINTFVREDWLKKLGLKEPTSLKEFENMLKAFKANASKLLGADADKLIPYSTSFDVGWRNNNLFMSFVPEKFSDKDSYIYGFDDRQFLYPGVKEAVRKLNEWYNAGLIWKDFPLYGAGDPTEDNLIKAGYVGAFQHNWDYPYRGGANGIHALLKKTAGPEAAYIAVDPFKNDAGKYRKILYPPVDRKVFFPITNKEPLASLLYLDWISKLENRRFLQIGEKGVNHEVLPDGTIKVLSVTGPQIMNSPFNIDYTIVVNGLDLGNPELTAKSRSLAYAEVEPRYIVKAIQTARRDGRSIPHFNCGEIKSEAGMDAALKQKRDNLLIQAIVCKPEEFDKVWDKGFQDYLNSGGQAIINERREKWEKYYGQKKKK